MNPFTPFSPIAFRCFTAETVCVCGRPRLQCMAISSASFRYTTASLCSAGRSAVLRKRFQSPISAITPRTSLLYRERVGCQHLSLHHLFLVYLLIPAFFATTHKKPAKRACFALPIIWVCEPDQREPGKPRRFGPNSQLAVPAVKISEAYHHELIRCFGTTNLSSAGPVVRLPGSSQEEKWSHGHGIGSLHDR